MTSIKDLTPILEEIATARGTTAEVLVNAIQSAMTLAVCRETGLGNLKASFTPKEGAFKIFQIKTVRAEVCDPDSEISIDDAAKYEPNPTPDTEIPIPYEYPHMGRLAAMTTRSMMKKTLTEIESDHRFEKLTAEKWKMVVATVRSRNEEGDYMCEVAGKIPAELRRNEQAFRENFKPGDMIKTVVVEVIRRGMDTIFLLSRTHPLLLRQLLYLEVPEIAAGTVQIVSLARDTMGRSKVGVFSANPKIDAVGACIGPSGERIRRIIKELNGENIDIIQWFMDPAKLIAAALTPAKVKSVRCDEKAQEAFVTLEPDQQAIAVGKKGLNIRLASRLTRWNIKVE